MHSAVVEGPPVVWTPVCVDGADALDLRCLQELTIDICPADQWLAYESDISSGARVLTGNQACLGADTSEGVLTQTTPQTSEATTGSTPVQIVVTLQDLQRLGVAASSVLTPYAAENIGLLGQHMHMWSDATVVTETITVLAQPVDVQLTPIRYHWHYGDGHVQTTTEPGQAVSADYVHQTLTSHQYHQTGIFTVQVTVTYAGQFRVGTNPWTPIGGTLDIPSEPTHMDIWRPKRVPVHQNCDQNPQGWGCDTIFQP